MKLRLLIEKDPDNGRYSAVFPELPGCASAGDTEEEAIANACHRADQNQPLRGRFKTSHSEVLFS
jgi:hypothetical protein